MIEHQQKLNVYSFQTEIQTTLGKVNLTSSTYRNSIVIIINQTGTIGSVIQGNLQGDTEQLIFNIRTLVGATDSEFYEILFRRLLQFVYTAPKARRPQFVTLIISLPLKNKAFDEKEYYSKLTEVFKKEIGSTLHPK